MERLLDTMRVEPLPVTRAEFESRALLYYILRQMEVFLLIKRCFCTERAAGKNRRIIRTRRTMEKRIFLLSGIRCQNA